MKWSLAHIFTLKEAPADAEITSHKLLIRGGLIKKLAPGIYSYGHVMVRALRKFEKIIREELNSRGASEILMPMVQPQELWEETNRWIEMGAGLLKFKNRNNQGFCLGATHEEAVCDYVRNEIKSYRDLPRNLYQIQTKYRDEIRPRFGLMRGREFIMNDAYSFDIDQKSALLTYEKMYQAYISIFGRLKLNFRIVQADAGNIGGSQTHEFQLLAQAGEDSLLVSDSSTFAANVEICPAMDFEPVEKSNQPLQQLETFATPGQKTIADLQKFTGVPAKSLVKSLFYAHPNGTQFCVLLRGNDEVNPIKLKNLLSLSDPPLFLTDDEVNAATGSPPGSCGPVQLKKPMAIYMDSGIEPLSNYIVGANKEGFHFKNVNHPRDFEPTQVADLRIAKAGDLDPTNSSGKLQAFRGIELGHVFYLGTKYSQKMGVNFLDSLGKSQPIEMGCYGIGVSRTVQACIEQFHDADGMIWPMEISPFAVHICLLDSGDSELVEYSDRLEGQLEKSGIDVLVDNRDERPGVKFKDADLLGFPIRVVLGRKGFDKKEIEIVDRATKQVTKVSPENALSEILGQLNALASR